MFSITFSLEGDSAVPLYEQLYRCFVGEIRSGALRSGEKLPSKRALCQHLGVSRSTVENAYGILCAEGYIVARPRSGFYVSDDLSFAFPPAPGTKPAPPAAPPAERPLLADFSTGAVDTSLFPYSSWAKLNKEVVYSSPGLLQRGDSQGEASLRRALAAFLGQYRGVRCDPEQIIIGAGLEYLMDLLLQLFPADTVFALEDPGYSAVYNTMHNNGRRVIPLPVDGEGLDVEALRASRADAAYITPSHQFPMGVTMPAGRRSRLLSWAAEKPGRYIIEDDYDSEFRYSSRPIPAMQGLDGRHVVYAGTFSRSIAPSIRVAYLVLPEPLLERYRRQFRLSSSTVSRYEQEVLARFISGGFYSRYLRKLSTLYRRRSGALCAALEEIPGIRVSGQGGGIHFLVSSDRLSEEELYTRALDAGIRLQRLSPYCRVCPPRPSTLVLGFGGVEDARALEAARILRDVWSKP